MTTRTWNGLISTDDTNALNWTLAFVPSPTENVVIGAAPGNVVGGIQGLNIDYTGFSGLFDGDINVWGNLTFSPTMTLSGNTLSTPGGTSHDWNSAGIHVPHNISVSENSILRLTSDLSCHEIYVDAGTTGSINQNGNDITVVIESGDEDGFTIESPATLAYSVGDKIIFDLQAADAYGDLQLEGPTGPNIVVAGGGYLLPLNETIVVQSLSLDGESTGGMYFDTVTDLTTLGNMTLVDAKLTQDEVDDDMNGCECTVGGAFLATNTNLSNGVINVTGTATAYNSTITGMSFPGTGLIAFGCIDGGGNTHVTFGLTWDGSTSLDWGTASNWDGNLVPTIASIVRIIGVDDVHLSADSFAKDLTFDATFTGLIFDLVGNDFTAAGTVTGGTGMEIAGLGGSTVTIAGDFIATCDLVGASNWTLDLSGDFTPTPGITITKCQSVHPLDATGCINGGGNNGNVTFGVTDITIDSVTSAHSNGSFKVAEVIDITTHFTDTVTVTGSPRLKMSLSNGNRYATYLSGSGSATLTFRLTIASGDTSADLDYVNTTALELNSGTITGASDVVLTLPTPGAAGSLGANKAIVIDTTAGTVTNVTSDTANGTYVGGQTMNFQVTVSEALTVTGTPLLPLVMFKDTIKYANYASGSGTTTHVYHYVIENDDMAHPIKAGTAISLNGGTIRDAATNNLVLTLPTAGGAGSLDFNKTIRLHTPMTPPKWGIGTF